MLCRTNEQTYGSSLRRVSCTDALPAKPPQNYPARFFADVKERRLHLNLGQQVVSEPYDEFVTFSWWMVAIFYTPVPACVEEQSWFVCEGQSVGPYLVTQFSWKA